PENDNRHFGNYEGVLPEQDSNFYREYTVETPGLDHRGQRRIITRGGSVQDAEVCYYTADHYDSFCEIPDAQSTPRPHDGLSTQPRRFLPRSRNRALRTHCPSTKKLRRTGRFPSRRQNRS